MATTFKTITKAELLEALEDLADDDQIAFASDYGDHCHTQQVHRLRGNINEHDLRESAYSDSGWALVEHDDESDGDEPQRVFILS
jgi:hypothetical protein